MNEVIKETLTEIMGAELKVGEEISVKVSGVLGKDILSLDTEMEGAKFAIIKMLVLKMSQNKDIQDIIRWAAMASYCVEVDAVGIPRLNKDERGGEV